MKITVYELLGMVKDGKAPKKIKYEYHKYYLYDNETYLTTDKTRIFDKIYFTDLNDEVEILEEPKGIPEKITMCTSGIMSYEAVEHITTELKDKINEILDYLESEGESNE